MSHTIILRHEGVDRTFHCQTQWDAIVLFDALSALGAVVEMWEGKTLRSKYDPSLTPGFPSLP